MNSINTRRFHRSTKPWFSHAFVQVLLFPSSGAQPTIQVRQKPYNYCAKEIAFLQHFFAVKRNIVLLQDEMQKASTLFV